MKEVGSVEYVAAAVARYVRGRQRARIAHETAAYEARFDQLARDQAGDWVAVHDGQLVDHDPNLSDLYNILNACRHPASARGQRT
jgi:hypothetical protein